MKIFNSYSPTLRYYNTNMDKILRKMKQVRITNDKNCSTAGLARRMLITYKMCEKDG